MGPPHLLWPHNMQKLQKVNKYTMYVYGQNKNGYFLLESITESEQQMPKALWRTFEERVIELNKILRNLPSRPSSLGDNINPVI